MPSRSSTRAPRRLRGKRAARCGGRWLCCSCLVYSARPFLCAACAEGGSLRATDRVTFTNLRAPRSSWGLYAKDVAHTLGFSASHYAEVEMRGATIAVEQARTLARLLNLDLAAFLALSGASVVARWDMRRRKRKRPA